MAEVSYNNSLGPLGAPQAADDTDITFTGSPGWATLADGDYIKLVVDPATSTNPVPNANFEIEYVTAYTGGSSTATVSRGQEGTTPVAHAVNATWLNGPTVDDFSGGGGGVTLGSDSTYFSADDAITLSADGASHQWSFQLGSPPAWFTPSSGPTDYSQAISAEGLYVFGIQVTPGVAPTTPGLYIQISSADANAYLTVPLDTGYGTLAETAPYGSGDVPVATSGAVVMPTDVTATITVLPFIQRLAF
jgi:hypothetical protein